MKIISISVFIGFILGVIYVTNQDDSYLSSPIFAAPIIIIFMVIASVFAIIINQGKKNKK